MNAILISLLITGVTFIVLSVVFYIFLKSSEIEKMGNDNSKAQSLIKYIN